jgi:PASTA domain
MLAANASGASTLTFSQLLIVLGIVAGAVIIAGLIVMWSRSLVKGGGGTEQSIVRSWLALTLVIGLVLFCGVALFLSDTNLRSVLIGGLAASTGTAVAFYFSSKASDQARQDILNATFGTETVPDLQKCTRDEAMRRLGQTSLQLVVDPTSSTSQDATVDSQMPLKDSQVRKGSSVTVKLVDGANPQDPGAGQDPGGNPANSTNDK